MAVWGHSTGCLFCTELFGHFTLPNGHLAHFYLPPAGAAAEHVGRAVAAAPPPQVPWACPDAPLACSVQGPTSQARHGISPGALPACAARRLLWAPVPALAPAPAARVLRGERREVGCAAGPVRPCLSLALGPLPLKAVVRETTRTEELLLPEGGAGAARRRSTAEGEAAAQRGRPAMGGAAAR
jgi:hypothetical protein